MTSFAGNRHDFHNSIINLWNLKGKKLLNKCWVRARQHDLWTFKTLLHLDNKTLNSITVVVHLTRYLLLRWNATFDSS